MEWRLAAARLALSKKEGDKIPVSSFVAFLMSRRKFCSTP